MVFEGVGGGCYGKRWSIWIFWSWGCIERMGTGTWITGEMCTESPCYLDRRWRDILHVFDVEHMKPYHLVSASIY